MGARCEARVRGSSVLGVKLVNDMPIPKTVKDDSYSRQIDTVNGLQFGHANARSPAMSGVKSDQPCAPACVTLSQLSMIGHVTPAAGVPSVSRRCGRRPWLRRWTRCGHPAALLLSAAAWATPVIQFLCHAFFDAVVGVIERRKWNWLVPSRQKIMIDEPRAFERKLLARFLVMGGHSRDNGRCDECDDGCDTGGLHGCSHGSGSSFVLSMALYNHTGTVEPEWLRTA